MWVDDVHSVLLLIDNLLFLSTFIVLFLFYFIQSLNFLFPHTYFLLSLQTVPHLLCLQNPPPTSSSTFVDKQDPYFMNTCSFNFAHTSAQLPWVLIYFIIFLLFPFFSFETSTVFPLSSFLGMFIDPLIHICFCSVNICWLFTTVSRYPR